MVNHRTKVLKKNAPIVKCAHSLLSYYHYKKKKWHMYLWHHYWIITITGTKMTQAFVIPFNFIHNIFFHFVTLFHDVNIWFQLQISMKTILTTNFNMLAFNSFIQCHMFCFYILVALCVLQCFRCFPIKFSLEN